MLKVEFVDGVNRLECMRKADDLKVSVSINKYIAQVNIGILCEIFGERRAPNSMKSLPSMQ